MKGKTFWILLGVILSLAFVVRTIPALGNNFYFTMDQGRDAVYVRDMLVRHRFPLMGPETNLRGVFAAPGWFYFISLGYVFSGGHPAGAVFLLVLLALLATALVACKAKKEISAAAAVLVAVGLQWNWWFYDISRYAFNPFPLVFLVFWLVLLLSDVLNGKGRQYLVAALPVGLAFHAEIAGAVAVAIFYGLIGLFALVRRKISVLTLMRSFVIVGFFFLPYFISEISTGFSQTQVLITEFQKESGVFSESAFPAITAELFKGPWRIPDAGIFLVHPVRRGEFIPK